MNTILLPAFKQDSNLEAINSLINSLTDNGDLAFGSMGKNSSSASLLELDHAMVRPKPTAFNPIKRTKDGHFAPNPEQFVLPLSSKLNIEERFNKFKNQMTSLPFPEQAKMWSLMLRYCFYLRNVRGEGKKERLLFYELFEKLVQIFPKTTEVLVNLVPDYGYFGDLDVLAKSTNKSISNAAVDCYIKNLNADCVQVFGKALSSITMAEGSELNTKLKAMTSDEIQTFVKGKKLSLAAKHLPREGKKDEEVRQMVLDSAFPEADRKNKRFMSQRFRYIITALTQCLAVGEQMMTTSGKATDIKRDWDDIDTNRAPAGFLNQHRLALLNETKSPPGSHQVETGNRSTREDRIQCRKNMMKSILEGKLKGLQLDLSKLAKEIHSKIDYNKNRSEFLVFCSSAERSMLSQQFKDMVTKIKETVDADYKEDPTHPDPRNVVPMVDLSGSMQSAKVDVEAIALGVLAANISNLPGCLITFSTNPAVLHLDLDSDVFEQFIQVMSPDVGFTTNIDGAYRRLLKLMVDNKVESADFALLILTDGHFNSGLVQFDGMTMSRSNKNNFEDVFLGRMEKAFKEKGFNLPRTIFWNLSHRGAYTATEDTKGVQMVNGFSQTLMLSVMTGDYKLVTDEKGNTRVDVDPWQSFVKSVTSDTFKPVLQVCLLVKEGCFSSLKV